MYTEIKQASAFTQLSPFLVTEKERLKQLKDVQLKP